MSLRKFLASDREYVRDALARGRVEVAERAIEWAIKEAHFSAERRRHAYSRGSKQSAAIRHATLVRHLTYLFEIRARHSQRAA